MSIYDLPRCFFRTAVNKLKGGNAHINISVHDIANNIIQRDTNRLMSGIPNKLQSWLNILEETYHSVLSLITIDALSATVST